MILDQIQNLLFQVFQYGWAGRAIIRASFSCGEPEQAAAMGTGSIAWRESGFNAHGFAAHIATSGVTFGSTRCWQHVKSRIAADGFPSDSQTKASYQLILEGAGLPHSLSSKSNRHGLHRGG